MLRTIHTCEINSSSDMHKWLKIAVSKEEKVISGLRFPFSLKIAARSHLWLFLSKLNSDSTWYGSYSSITVHPSHHSYQVKKQTLYAISFFLLWYGQFFHPYHNQKHVKRNLKKYYIKRNFLRSTSFLATLVALHFTPVSEWVSELVIVSN